MWRSRKQLAPPQGGRCLGLPRPSFNANALQSKIVGELPTQHMTACRKGQALVYTIGTLSVVAYCLYCLGFALAGTGLGLGMHAAAGQTFTALLSRAILKRQLSYTQLAAVSSKLHYQ